MKLSLHEEILIARPLLPLLSKITILTIIYLYLTIPKNFSIVKRQKI